MSKLDTCDAPDGAGPTGVDTILGNMGCMAINKLGQTVGVNVRGHVAARRPRQAHADAGLGGARLPAVRCRCHTLRDIDTRPPVDARDGIAPSPGRQLMFADIGACSPGPGHWSRNATIRSCSSNWCSR